MSFRMLGIPSEESPSSPRPVPRIEALRQKLSAAEQATGLAGECGAPFDLGIAAIDTILGGGLGSGALHEIAAVRESEILAATGFALGLTARFARRLRRSNTPGRISQGTAVLWIGEDFLLQENGAPYGPGLEQAGIAPEHLITVAATRTRDALWAMEEALRCRSVGVVIGETAARGLDQVAIRRLSLAAAAGDTLGLLLRAAGDDSPCAVATRWIVGAAPPFAPSSSERCRGVGPPRLTLHLTRNRRGRPGAWIVEWNSVEQRFELATHSEPLARAAFDRPYRAAVA
jgi:protein ImuA